MTAVPSILAAGGKNLAKVLQNIEQAMDELGEGPVKHTLGGALTGAANEGIMTTAEAADAGLVGYVFASEVNDANTCQPCHSIHGEFLGTTAQMDQVREHYPGGGFGGYVKCKGRERCRGTIRIKWPHGVTVQDQPPEPTTEEKGAGYTAAMFPSHPDEAIPHLDSLVEQGEMTQDQADALLDQITDAFDAAEALAGGAAQLAEAARRALGDESETTEEQVAEAAGALREGRRVVDRMPRHAYSDRHLRSWRDTKEDLEMMIGRAGREMIVHDETEGTLPEWEQSLTSNERKGVYTYTTAAYLPMNVALDNVAGARDRDGIKRALDGLDRHLLQRYRGWNATDGNDRLADETMELWAALDKHPIRAEPVTVFRGVHPDTARGYNPGEIYGAMTAGDEFVVRGFSSTGLQEAVSENFTGRTWPSNNGRSVMMEITTRVGANVISVAELGEGESEIILPPNTRFRVVKPLDPETQKIHLEVVLDE